MLHPIALTTENLPLIIRLVEAGVRQKELAEIFGRSQPQISRFLAKHQIKHPTKRPCLYDHDLILKCREDGFSADETAEKTGATKYTVYYVWQKALRGDQTKNRRPEVAPQEKRFFRKLRTAGCSIEQISRLTGRSTPVISKYLSDTTPEPYPKPGRFWNDRTQGRRPTQEETGSDGESL